MNPANQDSGGVEQCPIDELLAFIEPQKGKVCDFQNLGYVMQLALKAAPLIKQLKAKRSPAPTCGEGVATSFEEWFKFHAMGQPNLISEMSWARAAWIAAQAAQQAEIAALKEKNEVLHRFASTQGHLAEQRWDKNEALKAKIEELVKAGDKLTAECPLAGLIDEWEAAKKGNV